MLKQGVLGSPVGVEFSTSWGAGIGEGAGFGSTEPQWGSSEGFRPHRGARRFERVPAQGTTSTIQFLGYILNLNAPMGVVALPRPSPLERSDTPVSVQAGVVPRDWAVLAGLWPSTRPKRETIGKEAGELADAWTVLKRLTGSVHAPPDWAAEHDHYLYGSRKGKRRK